MKKEATPPKNSPEEVQEQTALQKAAADRAAAEAVAEQARFNKQQALARDDAIDLLDNVVAKVSTDRDGHIKLGAAVQFIRMSNAKLTGLENQGTGGG